MKTLKSKKVANKSPAGKTRPLPLKQPSLYLQSLRLKNFATFDSTEVTFEQGFNAIIGETGSGKSLLLDALEIILGGRGDKKLIRKDADYALLEATFSCMDPKVRSYLDELGHPNDEDEDEISIKRILYPTGKTKSFLNFIPCSVHTLLQFSKQYIDLVGQFENQKLLHEDYQLLLIDDFSDNFSLLEKYREKFHSYKELKKNLTELEIKKAQGNQKIDFLEFQLSEIEQLNPSVEDEEELIERKKISQNTEKKNKLISDILNTLCQNEDNIDVLSLLKRLSNQVIKQPQLIDPTLGQKFIEVTQMIEELSFQLSKEINLDDQEDYLNEILTRLDLYQKLKRKYNVTTGELQQLKTSFEEELATYKNLDQLSEKLNRQVDQTYQEAQHLALQLGRIRKIKSAEISQALTQLIRGLNMKEATVKIEVQQKIELDLNGSSEILFLAETNPGEGFHKIKEIASGGELSRILLAFRQVIAVKDTISIFLFDEIDTGMGGETAVKIGKALDQVAQQSQVIAITHLPQIAQFAQKLIVVSKNFAESKEGIRTQSLIKEVSGLMRKSEIKSMAALN